MESESGATRAELEHPGHSSPMFDGRQRLLIVPVWEHDNDRREAFRFAIRQKARGQFLEVVVADWADAAPLELSLGRTAKRAGVLFGRISIRYRSGPLERAVLEREIKRSIRRPQRVIPRGFVFAKPTPAEARRKRAARPSLPDHPASSLQDDLRMAGARTTEDALS